MTDLLRRLLVSVCVTILFGLAFGEEKQPQKCSKVKREVDPEAGVEFKLQDIYFKPKQFISPFLTKKDNIPAYCKGRRITAVELIACDYDEFPSVSLMEWTKPIVKRTGSRNNKAIIKRRIWCGSKFTFPSPQTVKRRSPLPTIYYPPLMN